MGANASEGTMLLALPGAPSCPSDRVHGHAVQGCSVHETPACVPHPGRGDAAQKAPEEQHQSGSHHEGREEGSGLLHNALPM